MPLGDLGGADPAVDRRTDLGIAEIDLGDVELRLGTRDLRGQRTFVGDVLVYRLLLAGRRLYQVLRPRELLLGEGVLRFELSDIRLVVVDLSLERRLFELIKEIALLDLGALDEQPLFEKRRDPRDQRHPSDRLDAANELVGLRDLLPFGPHDADRRRPGRRGLGPGGDGKHV